MDAARALDQAFHGVIKDERIVDALSTHWIKYFWPSCIAGLLGSISILLLFLAGFTIFEIGWIGHIAFSGGFALLLIVHHWYFHKLLSEYLVDIIITNKRIIFLSESLLFQDDMHGVPIEQVHAVEAHVHGLLQNILHYGSIWLDTGGTAMFDKEQTIHLVPHPHTVARRITELLHMK